MQFDDFDLFEIFKVGEFLSRETPLFGATLYFFP